MMTRRSWLKSLFQSQEDAIYFFGLQLIIKAFGEDTLRARLAAVINDPDGAQQDVAAKRRYIKRLVALLLEQRPYWHQVFWDYIAGRDQAETEFDSWTAELSAMMATEHEEIDQTVDGMFRLSHNKDYVAVTIALLLSEPYPPAEIQDESLFWRSETIAQLVNGLLYLNPEAILADAVFVVPGSPDDGLSEEDLMTGGWSYLRVLT